MSNSSDYLYDEKEDFVSNVDYTLPDSFSFLVNSKPTADPDFSWPTVQSLENNLSNVDSVYIIEGFPFVEFILNSLVATGLWLFLTWWSLPGHKDSQFSPLFVPDFYGDRCSQHLFDPYSFVHFGHGILSYHVFGHLDSFQETIITTSVKTGPNKKHKSTLAAKTTSTIGLWVTLVYATIAEHIENSQFVIDRFRNNTGM